MRHPGALFISLWAAATAIGWLLAHPIVQLFALQHIHVWGSAVIAIAVVATLLFSAARRKRNVDPRWLNIPINAGWALVAVVAFALGQPGSIAGVLQSLVLWPHFAASRRWMLASAVGAYFAFLLLSVVVLGNALLIYATAGFVIGVAQWLVLWKRVPRAGWWIAASALGYVAGGVAALAAGAGLNAAVGQLSPTVANAIGHTAPNLLGGVFYGAITGFWLARLLRARQSER